jgi:tRNA (cmo5U34)-methyltransferase
MAHRDQVYRTPKSQIVDFAFDTTVVDVFPDMIRRSVPGYETVIPLAGLLAARAFRTAANAPGRAYDLGCSLGATALAVLRQLDDTPCELLAVDSSIAMIERARTLVTDPRVTFVHADIRQLALQPARVVMLNYVLQFLPPDDRLAVLAGIRAILPAEGLLILSEKIRFEDAETERDFNAAHLAYKRANGYSELEISQKRSALENVMIIDSEESHRERLSAAGFTRVRKWYQCLNWASFEARP